MSSRESLLAALLGLKVAINTLENELLGAPSAPLPARPPQKRAAVAFPALFEEFWGLYPERRRKGKMAALKSWNANVLPEESHQRAVVEALRGQLGQRDWIKEGGQYVPMPTTWLNQHRWLDAVEGGNNGDAGKYGSVGETL